MVHNLVSVACSHSRPKTAITMTVYTKSDLLAEENAGLDTITLGADGAIPRPVCRVTLGLEMGGEGRPAPEISQNTQ